jgi:hypothetical protein
MLGIVAPGIEPHYRQDADGQRTAWMLHPDRSWTRAASADGEAPTVRQSGPRRLWDIVDDIRIFLAAGAASYRRVRGGVEGAGRTWCAGMGDQVAEQGPGTAISSVIRVKTDLTIASGDYG